MSAASDLMRAAYAKKGPVRDLLIQQGTAKLAEATHLPKLGTPDSARRLRAGHYPKPAK